MLIAREHTRVGGGGCRAAAQQNPEELKFKDKNFVNIMISIVFRD
jgi:hypothetical protein